MRKLFIFLISALSLTAVAQEKKTIVILQPQSKNTVAANLVKGTLARAFVGSEEWQSVERPSEDEMNRMMLAGEPVGNLQPAKYILTTVINEDSGMLYITCNIIDKESGMMVGSAMEMCETSPQSILQASSSLAKQLLEKQE